MRSGRMKSSTAAPSFRNSGLETTAKPMSTPRAASSSAIASRTRSAVPTGTVDLSTTIRGSVMCRPMLRAAASTYCRSAEPSSSGGVPTAMNCSAPCATRGIDVGGEAQPPGGGVARDHGVEAGLVDRDAAGVEQVDLAAVDVEAQDVVADLGETGAGDQTDVARSDHRDFHVRAPIVALMAVSAASGSRACVIGRPITR